MNSGKHLFSVIGTALIIALAAFTGAAFADPGHGHGGGNQGQAQQAPSQSSNQAGQQQQTSHGPQHGGSHQGGGQSKHQQRSSGSTSGGNSQGVKPSNTTQHDTHASASSDKTKKYGNGKTAGQIATQAGYGDSTLHGPGNSQPHKTNCGGRHEVDVHALKNKKCGETSSQSPPPPVTTTESHGKVEGKTEHSSHSAKATVKVKSEEKSGESAKVNGKITICHKTGSASNPYVEITVSVNALKHGHTAAKGDIIPAPADGCPGPQLPLPQPKPQPGPQVSFCDMTSATTGVIESKPASEVVKHELDGTPEEARDIVPPFTYNGQSYSQLWDTNGQSIFNNGCNLPSTTTTTTTAAVADNDNDNEGTVDTDNDNDVTVTTTVTTPAVTTTAPAVTTTVAAAGTAGTTDTTTTTAAAGSVKGANASSGPASTTTATPAAAGGVKAATASGHSPSSGHSGVLGTVASSTLPYTGLPIWLVVLVALALIGIGLAFRARTRPNNIP